MTDPIERMALVQSVYGKTRPVVNQLIDKYTEYRTKFMSEPDGEEHAFQALIKYIQVGLEMGHYDDKSMIIMTAFLARRVSHLKPLLAASLPN